MEFETVSDGIDVGEWKICCLKFLTGTGVVKTGRFILF